MGTTLVGGLSAPALAQARGNVITAIPISNLSGLDPIITSGQPVRNHGYQIYDTLFAFDQDLNVRPQMADGYDVSADGKTWTIKLRAGLTFHDKEPVLARDCVASIRRWGSRDPLGQTMLQVTDELSASDDKTIIFRLKSPFGLVAQALAKIGGPAPFIMPERIAQTDSTKPITEAIGSGPYRFLADEWVPGDRVSYAKFEGYVPRNEPPSGTAGGKMVYVDRYEWRIIPDAATATAAMQQGEVDWYHNPDVNLLPILQGNPDIDLTPFDDFGFVSVIRFNHLQPPFNNVKMRQAVMAAVTQVEYLAAQVGDPARYEECKSMFFCHTTSSTGTGNEVMLGDFAQARQMIIEAGYNGEKVVMISPTDLAWLHNASLVTEDLLRRMGVNVELQAMDLATFYTRRTNTEPVDKGGWSVFHAGFSLTDMLDPSTHLGLQANGRAAWPGWPTDTGLEEMRASWMQASDQTVRLQIAKEIEKHVFQTVPFVPLGRFQTPSARQKNITGMVKAPIPISWNLKKEA